MEWLNALNAMLRPADALIALIAAAWAFWFLRGTTTFPSIGCMCIAFGIGCNKLADALHGGTMLVVHSGAIYRRTGYILLTLADRFHFAGDIWSIGDILIVIGCFTLFLALGVLIVKKIVTSNSPGPR